MGGSVIGQAGVRPWSPCGRWTGGSDGYRVSASISRVTEQAARLVRGLGCWRVYMLLTFVSLRGGSEDGCAVSTPIAWVMKQATRLVRDLEVGVDVVAMPLIHECQLWSLGWQWRRLG